MSSIYVVGIMTGTSCDGADASCVKYTIKNNIVQEQLIGTHASTFHLSLKKDLLNLQKGRSTFLSMAETEVRYSRWLSDFANQCVKKYKLNPNNSFFAIHGQTIWHNPKNKYPYSIQLLDPNIIAAKTGFVVISNFRQTDIALGGEGAPLVPLYNILKSKSLNLSKKYPFSIHNIGGIANLCIVSNHSKELLAFDTGPGNTLIDLSVQKFTSYKKFFDTNGLIAKKFIHTIDDKLIKRLANDAYFKKSPPKSTGKEMFNLEYLNKFKHTGGALVANATAFTALTIAYAYQMHVLKKVPKLQCIYISGGGSKNPTLIKLIKKYINLQCNKPIPVQVLDKDFGPPQFLESTAFARLGYEAIRAKPTSLKSVTGAKRDAIGARITTSDSYLELMKNILKA